MNCTLRVSGTLGRLGWALILPGLMAVAGCRHEQIQVYTAPKDPAPAKSAAEAAAADEVKSRPHPQITWKLPDGWKVGVANEISMASFRIFGSGGKEAEVSITQLGNLAGRESLLVNMWRSKAGQKALSDEDALKELRPVTIGTEQGSLFEVSGQGLEEPVKIVTAMLHHPDGSWFFKLSGEASLVAEQQPKFLDFLKSINIQSAAMSADADVTASAPTASTDSGGGFNWRVPGKWKTEAPGDMQVARFAIPGGRQGTEVFVSVFPGDTGGTLANVTRWRRQVGLPPPDEKDLPSLVAPLDPSHPDAILVDMTNNGKRLVGAIVPRDGKYWFYKLLGDPAVVGGEKDSFVAFAKSNP